MLQKCFFLLALYPSLSLAQTPYQLQHQGPWLMHQNYLEIQPPCPSCILTTNNGQIQIQAQGYRLMPQALGSSYLRLQNSQAQALQEFQVEIESYKAYTRVSLGGKHRGSLSLSSLRQQKGLSAEVLNQNIDLRLPILEFQLLIFRNGQIIQTLNQQGPLFNAPTLALFEQLRPGDGLYFRNIKALNDGISKTTIDLYPIYLELE